MSRNNNNKAAEVSLFMCRGINIYANNNSDDYNKASRINNGVYKSNRMSYLSTLHDGMFNFTERSSRSTGGKDAGESRELNL